MYCHADSAGLGIPAARIRKNAGIPVPGTIGTRILFIIHRFLLKSILLNLRFRILNVNLNWGIQSFQD